MNSAPLAMGGSWLTLILSMCLTTIILLLLARRGKFLYALRKVPHPLAFPFIGNAYQLCCSPEGKRNVFQPTLLPNSGRIIHFIRRNARGVRNLSFARNFAPFCFGSTRRNVVEFLNPLLSLYQGIRMSQTSVRLI